MWSLGYSIMKESLGFGGHDCITRLYNQVYGIGISGGLEFPHLTSTAIKKLGAQSRQNDPFVRMHHARHPLREGVRKANAGELPLGKWRSDILRRYYVPRGALNMAFPLEPGE